MKKISEDALIPFCLDHLPADLRDRILLSDPDRLNSVRSLLAEHLLQTADVDPGVVYEAEEMTISQGSDLGFRIGRVSADGNTIKLYTFGFKDAAKATALQILGLGLAVFLAPVTLAQGVQALAIVKSLWEKLIVLERPQNGDAIDMMEAIGKHRAAYLAEGVETMPSTEELLAGTDSVAATAALKWLEGQKLIEAALWGGQAGDASHPQTRWRICL